MASRFTGVLRSAKHYHGSKHYGGWQAATSHRGRRKQLDTFKRQDQAARAYDRAALNLKHDRKLNFPNGNAARAAARR